MTTILIVDDEPPMTGVLTECLAGLGCELAVAGDGFEALEHMRRQPPALVLLDIMMPGMGGWELVRRIRAEPALQDIPVVVITARRTGLSPAGLVQALLFKPFDVAELRQTVSALLAD